MWRDYGDPCLGGYVLLASAWQLHLVLAPDRLHGAFWRRGFDGGTWLLRVASA